MAHPKVDHVTLLVASMDTSMPYYDALLPLLGFETTKPGIWRNPDGFHIQFREASPGTSPYERYGAGMNHIGFGVDDPDTVERVRTAMADAGFDVPDIQILSGAKALFMKDPDGIRFEVTWYPEGVPVVD